MKLTVNQMKMMLAFYKDDDKSLRYAQFSKESGIPKYEVSRIGKQLAELGLITDNEQKRPVLSEKGICEARVLSKKLESARAHMIYEGVSTQDIEKTAEDWAINGPNSLFEAIDRIDMHYKTKSLFNAWEKFSGYDLCRKIGDGLFTLPFMFYKMQPNPMSPHTNISMASEGFYKTCEVIVHNGAGKLILTPIAITSDKTPNGRIVTGKASEFRYWNGTDYVPAEMLTGKIVLPMDNFSFINMGEEIANRVMHGSLEVEVNCSGGGMAHSMTAMLTIFLH